jgi:threonine/homoserine/homoserine lactone efflux protein
VTIFNMGLVALLYSAAPGPLNAETLRRGLRSGFWAALGTQLGSLTGEAMYALLAFAGLAVVAGTAVFHFLLPLVGATLLLALGLSSLRQAWHEESIRAARWDTPRTEGRSLRLGALLGAAISLANPLAITFWLAVGGTVLHQARVDAPPVVAGFVLGRLLWAVGVPALLGAARPAIGHHAGTVYTGVSVVCGLALIGFGLHLAQPLVGG